jgi:hypothetical protein
MSDAHIQHLEARLGALEAVAYGGHTAPDHSAELKAIKSELAQLKADVGVALARPIPDTKNLASKAELQHAIETMAVSIAKQAVENDQVHSQQAKRHIERTVGEVAAQTLTAQNISASMSRFAADLLISKANHFGQ